MPGIGANYLTNPGFESALDGWTASPGSSAAAVGEETGYPVAFGGSSYFAAGAVQQGTVSQTVNLLIDRTDGNRDRRRRARTSCSADASFPATASRRTRARSR